MSTNSGPATGTGAADVLADAATAALRAPSIFNTQPWHWRVDGGALELSADRSRQLPNVDPDGQMLTLSCGIALHHALTALAAEGWTAQVRRLPDPDRPDLLAEITLGEHHHPEPAALRRYEAIQMRHTDRRPFTDQPVPIDALAVLREAAQGGGVHLQPLRPEQLPELIVAAGDADAAESGDPGYRAELREWTNRPPGAGDGVPLETAAGHGRRRVSLRDFALTGEQGWPTGPDLDTNAVYAILYGEHDDRTAWLRGGEALSAVMLAAVTAGLSISPMSDIVEVGSTRNALRHLLGGIGYPYLALRIGVTGADTAAPGTPRREASDVIELE